MKKTALGLAVLMLAAGATGAMAQLTNGTEKKSGSGLDHPYKMNRNATSQPGTSYGRTTDSENGNAGTTGSVGANASANGPGSANGSAGVGGNAGANAAGGNAGGPGGGNAGGNAGGSAGGAAR